MQHLLQKKIIDLFDGNEWQSTRRYLTRRRDMQPFMSATVIAILSRCRNLDPVLTAQINACRRHLPTYQKGHLTYFWPVVNGISRMPNAPILSRFKLFAADPDADTVCLQQLALNREEHCRKIAEELVYYRVDGSRFKLPHFQQKLPATANSFLTWFPPRLAAGQSRVESVDAGVDANILWFLGITGQLQIPGAAETTNFLKTVVHSELVRTDPFRISMYYPFPAVLLYLISRAVHWGKLKELYSLRSKMLELIGSIQPGSAFDRLCLASAALHWGEKELAAGIAGNLLHSCDYPEAPIFVWPILSYFLMRAPFPKWLVERSFFQMKFQCRALQLSMQLYLVQQLESLHDQAQKKIPELNFAKAK